MGIYKKIRQKCYGDKTPSQIKKELDKLEVEKRSPSGFWRKKYPCKRNKGEHEFDLVLPDNYWWPNSQNVTIDEFYEKEFKEAKEARKEKIERYEPLRYFGDHVFFHWKCIHCGKKEWDTSDHLMKKVRNNLKEPIACPWVLTKKI